MGLQQSARCYADIRKPEPWAFCDRCNFRYFHHDLRWQFDFRGPKMANLRILVCESCFDEPYHYNKPIVISADPVPVKDARPGYLAQQAGPAPPPFFAFRPQPVPPGRFTYLTDDLGNIITDDHGQPIEIEGGTTLAPPTPVVTFQYLTDDLGNVVTDDLGQPIEFEVGGGGPTPLPPPSPGAGGFVFNRPGSSQYVPVIL